jgi:hypothetical protein
MGSFKHLRAFDPLDLEVIDRVFEAAWARFEASDVNRDRGRDEERKTALRRWVLALADHPVDFDDICAKLDRGMPAPWAIALAKKRGPGSKVIT